MRPPSGGFLLSRIVAKVAGRQNAYHAPPVFSFRHRVKKNRQLTLPTRFQSIRYKNAFQEWRH
jgi:hypothetical protein